ncbi:hypothetical protein SmJEL517_g01177 [Synchytrium microbalum]|uniref:NADP-dependent oxidoreductase domain-containing protein n=1 Tax=Synchytrium microbalum TaxID=1806994 RepID=A0A507CFA4_9FUNG|nr:uncharacterized protein SmJEL517_g01177 [Synchytrium microbalum]TPX36604.1 hypothetical protein SmJEL517_g01177 [Synchytrium microbalum]
MALNRTFVLSAKGCMPMPAFGLGTWQSKPNEVKQAVLNALQAGYRHIDAAAIYGNENEVGEALVESKVPREQVFITSKLWNDRHRKEYVEGACRTTLKDLKTSYLDLYLMHWPIAFKLADDGKGSAKNADGSMVIDDCPISETWAAMESLVDKGLVKAIGVSNFSIARIQELLKTAKITPAVNQVELHPYNPQNDLLAFCKKHNILLTAYSPFGSGRSPSLFDDDVLLKIAKKYNKSVAQVLVSWQIQRGVSVIPKSVTPARIAENFQDFILEDSDMALINELGTTKPLRYLKPYEWAGWGNPDVFGDAPAKI